MESFVEDLAGRADAADRIVHRRRETARAAEHADLDVHPRVERALDERGIDALYRHQADAVEALRDGRDVVVATPTASGKSLVYTIPAIERALESGERTLYVAPTRALINDQTEALESFVSDLGFGPRVAVAQYTGRQSQSEKRRVREAEPHVVLTTPDMLHYGLLPHAHRLWEWLVDSLGQVVIDEVHEYRGVFGSHVSLVCRRLARLCERFGADPRYVCCSATIGNPVEHAATVTGRPESSFALVDEDTSARGAREWLLWNPPRKRTGASPDGGVAAADGQAGGERRSPHPEASRLLCDLVQRGHQAIVFVGSRQVAERYATRSADRLRERGEPDLADRIAAYQAALPDERRTTIERRLESGDLRGVWATNALELGIDVGGLDAVLLDGYPGTRMETRQRAGRAGRGDEASLVALVAGRDQLDQYLMAEPETLFDAPPERAAVNPENDALLPDHVRCAARENWLSPADESHFGGSFPDRVAELTEAGALERRQADAGLRWTNAEGEYPHRSVSLRSIDDREVRLRDVGRDETIATLGVADALRDAHPGAIYHHQGRTYEVAALELEDGRALLRETVATHHTRALREKDVRVEAVLDERTLADYADLPVGLAAVVISERIERYVRYEGPGDDEGTVVELPEALPETTLRTEGFFLTLPDAVADDLRAVAGSTDAFLGALHATEHALISLLPTELLCDRRDVGGLSTNAHPDTGRPTVFVHEGYPGGVGLARGGYDSIGRLLGRTHGLLVGCDCEAGCPACVQSPHCGNANRYLEKDLAVTLLSTVDADEAPDRPA